MRKGITGVDKWVAGRIVELRQERRIPRRQVAEMLGVSEQQLQKYEAGINKLNSGKLWELSKIYGVSIGAFFRGYQGEAPKGKARPPGYSSLSRREKTALQALIQTIAEQR